MSDQERSKRQKRGTRLNPSPSDRSEGVAPPGRGTPSAVEDISVNGALDPVVSHEEPEHPDPQYVWVRFAAEAAPHDGLAYRADPTSLGVANDSPGEEPAPGQAREEGIASAVGRAVTEVLTRLVFRRDGANAVPHAVQPSTTDGHSVVPTDSDYYTLEHLPPHTSVRAFQRALRSGIPCIKLSHLEAVTRTAWLAHLEANSRPRLRAARAALPSKPTDDELLAAVGARPANARNARR